MKDDLLLRRLKFAEKAGGIQIIIQTPPASIISGARRR
jgi:hypothetical protein